MRYFYSVFDFKIDLCVIAASSARSNRVFNQQRPRVVLVPQWKEMASPRPANNKILQFKLVLLGEAAVGKSSLVLRFVKGHFQVDFDWLKSID